MRPRRVAAIALHLAVLLSAAGAASGAERPACDDRPGRTLAATPQLRLLSTPRDPKRGREAELLVCSVETRTGTALVSGRRSVRLAKVAVAGSVAAAAHLAYSTVQPNSSGIAFSSVVLRDVASRRTVVTNLLTGLVVRDLVITTGGQIAVIADPFGKAAAAEDDPDQSSRRLTAAGVFLADGRATKAAAWVQVDNGPPASLTGLTFTGSTLVWQHDGGLRSHAAT